MSARTAIAQFRDLDDRHQRHGRRACRCPPSLLDLPAAGPDLAITEIMYHPAERADGRATRVRRNLQSPAFYEDISGYSISGDVSFTFPAGTILTAGATLVIARSPADLQAIYGISNVTGPYTNNLSNTAGTVRLRGRSKEVLLEVKYDSQAPWPVAADGAGHSLVLARPSYGEGDYRAWSASDAKGGSPGQGDGVGYRTRSRGGHQRVSRAHRPAPARRDRIV